jgi:hypothetical protein
VNHENHGLDQGLQFQSLISGRRWQGVADAQPDRMSPACEAEQKDPPQGLPDTRAANFDNLQAVTKDYIGHGEDERACKGHCARTTGGSWAIVINKK